MVFLSEHSNDSAVQKLVSQMISTNFTLASCTVCSIPEVGYIRTTKEISMPTYTALLTGSGWRYQGGSRFEVLLCIAGYSY